MNTNDQTNSDQNVEPKTNVTDQIIEQDDQINQISWKVMINSINQTNRGMIKVKATIIKERNHEAEKINTVVAVID